MRDSSPELQDVLTGSFSTHWEADLYYDDDRRMTNLPITNVQFTEDGDAKVQQSGSCTVVWTDEFATSVSPTMITDALAPFGAQLWVWCVIEAGQFTERVEYGHYEITDVPSARDEHMQFRGEWLTTGSVVDLTLAEITNGIGMEKWAVPTPPYSLTSTWDELGRITGLQLFRSVTDQPITRSYAYQDNKLDVVYDLCNVMLDGVPHIMTDGTLMVRPNTWPDPVYTLTRADHIVAVGMPMSADQVYNDVVVTSYATDQSVILARASIPDGPLRVAEPDGSPSPFRRRTYAQSSQLVTTFSQAYAWAESTLAQVSVLRTREVPVTVIFNPLIERGDVVLIERPTEWWTCRVVTIDRSQQGTQDMKVQVGTVTYRTDLTTTDVEVPGDWRFDWVDGWGVVT